MMKIAWIIGTAIMTRITLKFAQTQYYFGVPECHQDPASRGNQAPMWYLVLHLGTLAASGISGNLGLTVALSLPASNQAPYLNLSLHHAFPKK